MINLIEIQEFIQNYVRVISSIVEANVTVVDQKMLRVAGTGEYAESIGTKISEKSFFKTILDTGSFGSIHDVQESEACSACCNYETCNELASLASPIFFESKVIGVIGIIAFSKQEKERLFEKIKHFEDFLKYMSQLLESKLFTSKLNKELKSQVDAAKEEQTKPINRLFIGNSSKIKEVIALAEKVASNDSTVMITGENGTGKDILANYIHMQSTRKDKFMISVNCAAIPENLVESELFGYEAGSFTGAKSQGHIGKFELANESTIFLDEIGDMPMHIQSKLLRVLQDHKVEPIGAKHPVPVNLRVICATNKNLEAMVKEGKFRQDLYYRLSVIPLQLPALRERKEDILLFVNFFIEYYNKQLKKNILGIQPEAMDVLYHYSWPGNVRELRNIIEYLVNIVGTRHIEFSDLPSQLHTNVLEESEHKSLQELLTNYEKTILSQLVRNTTTLKEKDALATQLGISRATLYRKLASYEIQ